MRIPRMGGRSVAAIGMMAILGTATIAALSPPDPASATGSAPAAAPLDDCRPASFVRGVNEGFPIEVSALPSRGTGRITSIYADFSDAPGDPAAIPALEADSSAATLILETQSGARLDLDRTSASQWARLPLTSGDYAAITDGRERTRRLMTDAVAAVDGSVDFSSTDVVWVTLAPSSLAADAEEFHPIDIPSEEGPLTRAVLFTGFHDTWIMVHESGHTLGLPDLYDMLAVIEGAEFIFPFTGGWDPMGAGFDARGREFLGWHRWRLGWIEDSAVTCVAPGTSGELLIDSLGLRGPSTIAVVRISQFEVLVVESRHADGYDDNVDIKTGALVYRVNANQASGSGPVRVVMPDGIPAFTDLVGSYEAPLVPGERYTDPSGVVVEALPRPDPSAHQDLVRIDTTALGSDGPDDGPDDGDGGGDGGNGGGTGAEQPATPTGGSTSAGLPATGSDASGAALIAMLLIGVGGALALLRNRARRTPD